MHFQSVGTKRPQIAEKGERVLFGIKNLTDSTPPLRTHSLIFDGKLLQLSSGVLNKMAAKHEFETGGGAQDVEGRIRGAWKDFYSGVIDERARKGQLEEIINSSPPEIREWLFEIVGGGDGWKPINKIMEIAVEELVSSRHPKSRGERKFVRREKAKIRRG